MQPSPYALPPRPIASPPRWRDDINPLFFLMLALGVVGALILAAGAIEFLVFEPLGQSSGMTAQIKGTYHYDTAHQSTVGRSVDHFTQDDAFAAVVNWRSVPADTVVAARWYDSFGEEVGGLGPETAGNLANSQQDTVPAGTNAGDRNLPGHYLFVVERYVNGSPVEVIGRAIVLVQRG